MKKACVVAVVLGLVLLPFFWRWCLSPGLPVASVSMPEGWILGGKSMWSQGNVREHFCYLFARSADGRHTMFANPVYSFTPHLALGISLMEKLDWESECVQVRFFTCSFGSVPSS